MCYHIKLWKTFLFTDYSGVSTVFTLHILSLLYLSHVNDAIICYILFFHFNSIIKDPWNQFMCSVHLMFYPSIPFFYFNQGTRKHFCLNDISELSFKMFFFLTFVCWYVRFKRPLFISIWYEMFVTKMKIDLGMHLKKVIYIYASLTRRCFGYKKVTYQ